MSAPSVARVLLASVNAPDHAQRMDRITDADVQMMQYLRDHRDTEETRQLATILLEVIDAMDDADAIAAEAADCDTEIMQAGPEKPGGRY
jgi:hypothetical protein